MRPYFYSLAILCVVFFGQITGNDYGLYLGVWPFDIAMHFLGGLGIGLAVIATVELHMKHVERRTAIVLLTVFAAGIGWEIFEAYYDIAGYPFGTTGYWLEFTKDIIDDMLGAAVSLMIISSRSRLGQELFEPTGDSSPGSFDQLH